MSRYYKKFNAAALIFVFIFLCLSFDATAARSKKEDKGTPWYQVEVIVFVNKQQTGLATETWPDDYPASRFKDIIDLAIYNEIPYTTVQPPQIEKKPKKRRRNKNKKPPQAYLGPKQASTAIYNKGAHVILSRQEHLLSNIARRVANSQDYDLLLHVAWRQPTYGKSDSIPVFVFEGMQNPDKLVRTNVANPNMALEQLPIGPNYHRLSGTFRLSVSRYLHLEADLHYKSPMLQEELIYDEDDGSGGFGSFFGMQGSTPITREREVVRDFRLFESRRMRSKEIHYYDHPMLGVVSKIIPYEHPPEPEFVAPETKAPKAKSNPTKRTRPRQ